MDSALNARLRAIVDRLLASTLIAPPDRRLVEEAKELLAATPRPTGTITVRTCSSTMPEPMIVTLRMPEAGR